MNDDLISREYAIKTLLDEGLITAAVYIERMPSADLSEYCDKLWKTAYERGKAEAHSRTGKWVYDEERGARGIYAICTACNEMIYQTGGFNYCPNCGARMEESDG